MSNSLAHQEKRRTRETQKAKERRIIHNANRIRSAPKKLKGSGRLVEREGRIKERQGRNRAIANN